MQRQTKTLRTVDCNTTNVIYLLECSLPCLCNTQSMGETKRAFKHRLKEHIVDIEYNRDQCQHISINTPNRKEYIM